MAGDNPATGLMRKLRV